MSTSYYFYSMAPNCQSYYIMNGQKDGIGNYLTPTKLLQSSQKPRTKINLNESQHSRSIKKNKQQTLLNISSNHIANQSLRMQQNFEKSRAKDDEIYLHDSKEKFDRNVMLYDTSKTVLKSQDNFKLLVDDRQNIKIAALKKSQVSQHPIQQEINPPVGQVLAKITNSYKNSRVQSNKGEELSKNLQLSRNHKEEYASNNVPNTNFLQFQGSIDQLNNLMQILKGLRDTMDSSLSQLQHILDNTSKYLNDINQEYLRIKQRILDYTAQVLDASFTRYKQNMINWTKYEEVQKKTIVIKGQLEKNIKQDQMIVKEMTKSSKSSRLALGKQQQLEQKIQFYGGFLSQLQNATQQCLQMHPQITKEKVAAFEQALSELANF